MKTIGLLGGMSWESSAAYYRAINEGIKTSLGGLHSAEIAMVSIDFEPIEKMQMKGDWEGAVQILADAALSIQAAGADFLLICTNTMHKVAPAETLVKENVKAVGLLGTAFTMEEEFYKGRLSNKYGLNVLIPNQDDREIVHRIIYEELCLGNIKNQSRAEYLRVIDSLAEQGAEAIILGCTEIGLLLSQNDTSVKLFDTTMIHAQKAVEYAIQ